MIEPINVPILLDLELEEEELDLSIEEAEEYAAQIGSLITISEVYGGLPSGGNSGDIIVKNSGEDYDASWCAPASIVKDGNGIWYTTDRVSSTDPPFTRRRSLIGREGATVQVHDLLIAPAPGEEGEPTTLYEITRVSLACDLSLLCKLKGEDGSNIVDSEFSTDSENPVQNKVITAAFNTALQQLTELGLTVGGLGAALDGKVDKVTGKGLSSNDYTDEDKLKVTEAATETWVQLQGYITDTSLSDYRTALDQDNIDDAQNRAIDAKYTKPIDGIPASDLAPAVQTSLGKADTALQSVPSTYRTAAAQDIIDAAQDAAIAAKYTKPTGGIPDSDLETAYAKEADVINAIDQLIDRIDSGYTKPSDGIPKSDLANDVQTSLGKADTALQEHQSLTAYRTAADQDTIDEAQDTAIGGKLDTTGNAYRTASIPMGHLDSTSTATVMTATVPGITELRDGVCMWLTNGVVSSASGFTLNINGLGAKPVYGSLAAATRSTTVFGAAYTMLFVYNSTRVDGGCWDCVYGYDSNTNTIGYQLRTNSGTRPVSDQTGRYRLLFSSADNTKWVPANTANTTNATSARAVNQRPINPFGPIVYYSYTTVYAAGTNVGTGYQWSQYVVTLGYSFNRTGAALALTHPAPVYIKCAPQSDGSAIIDADAPYVQSLPSTEDGKIYIYLGIAASATTVELIEDHPVYCYRNGAIRVWTGPAEASSFVATYTIGQTNSCDKTYAELMAAWLEGQTIYARLAGMTVGQTANVYADPTGNMIAILTASADSVLRITHTSTNEITSEWLAPPIDTQIDPNSINPVTNAAIAAALDRKADIESIPIVPQIDSTLSVSGAAADAFATGIAIAARYAKPSNGIPASDLEETYLTQHQDISGKLDIAQGIANAGKFIMVGSDGNITAITMAAWQGGNY